ncbi:hypothetical protein [Cytobacillus praedii]|uniref:hypothetical protein n=1 Tax=Cytobacillus praedii TaxID=1742358 RepID=UPI002E21110D|nr:hypothetical protein [Cytobacillus praedii]
MYIITNKAKRLVETCTIIEEVDSGFYVKDKNYIIGFDIDIYEVPTIPEDVQPYIHCYTPDKGFYPYVEPETPPKPKTPIELLQEENAMLQMSVIELSTYTALQDERLKGQEQAILELSMLVAGGGA